MTIPNQAQIPKNCTFTENDAREMNTCIQKLLALGSIVETNHTLGEFISSIFFVPKTDADGPSRFILNLEKLNKFLQNEHFKMDYRTVRRLMTPKCYFGSIDKEAYNLIPIQWKHRKYLRYVWDGKLYEFTCLPFGLSSGPRLFTKILKPVTAWLRTHGVTMVVYLDDILILESTERSCELALFKTIGFLESLGFVINYEKSQIIPTQSIRYLGFIFDSKNMSVSLPTEKRDKILKLCHLLKHKLVLTVREFAQFIGTLVSVCPAVPYGILYTKIFENAKFMALRNNPSDYERKVSISKHIIADFEWWEQTIPTALSIIRTDTYALEIFSDASKSGWGIACGKNRSHGWWSSDEAAEPINILELRAAYYGLKCYAASLSSIQILLRIDNTTAISYINRMGGVQLHKYNDLARKIWQFCESRQIWIFASYIASKSNIIADAESRCQDSQTEWDLNSLEYKRVIEKLGQPSWEANFIWVLLIICSLLQTGLIHWKSLILVAAILSGKRLFSKEDQ